jgi:hypothetical protein
VKFKRAAAVQLLLVPDGGLTVLLYEQYLSKFILMACDFSISFTGDATTVLAKAKKAVESQGGNFNGDTNRGDFQVSVFGNKIVGNYTVGGQSLQVNITDKPFMVPCSAIESFLKSQVQ